MFNTLNASIFKKFAIPFRKTHFEKLLAKVTECYHLMIDDGVCLTNDENKIRDVLLINYLSDNTIRQKVGLIQWDFEREVEEDRLAGKVGRTDIKVITLNTFVDQAAYYILECKRLDNKNLSGVSGLNAKYIKEGMKRYTDKYYSSHYRENGMIAFIVERLNIDSNVIEINTLLTTNFTSVPTIQPLKKHTIPPLDFDYLYKSIHTDKDGDELRLYHLMFDFSNNII